MTGLSAQGDDGLGGFLVSDETSDLGDRAFGRSGWAEGRGEIDASTAELAVNGLVEDDADGATSPVVNVSPAFSQDAGTDGGAQSAAATTEAPVTIADGGAAAIEGPSSQSVVFAGSSGTLTLDDAQSFTGQISGLSGADAIDLADISYGADTQVTFLGNAAGGTLTVTDGTETANITLVGDYLSSTWDLSSDGHGGVTVVDPVTNTTWQTLKVGGGGYVRGLDVAPDGTMVGRTDTNGAYLWHASTSSWVQLVTASSMPAAFIAADPAASGTGVFEIQIADSNTQILYMIFDGYMFKSTNQGTTWTQQTSFNGGAQISANPNDSYGEVGQKMAVDPNNPNIVYAGSEGQGMFVTTNGGTTWTSVSAIPAGGGAGITGILFDPGASAGVVGGVTQTIFASSYGNGVYESTNGGTTWTQLTGGPTDVEYAAVSSTGVYYAVGDSNSSLWSYASGKWTELLSNTQYIQAVAVDPSNPQEIVAQTAGGGERPQFQGDLGRVRALPGPLPEPNEVDRARRGAPGSEAGSRGHAGTLRRAQRPPRSTWEGWRYKEPGGADPGARGNFLCATVVAGDGPLRAALEAGAAEWGVADRLHLLGDVGRQECSRSLGRASDVFVFPSIRESFGLAAVEAALLGRPIVASDLDVLKGVLAGHDVAAFAGPSIRSSARQPSERDVRSQADHQLVLDFLRRIVRIHDPAARIEDILDVGLNLPPRHHLILIGCLEKGLVGPYGGKDAGIIERRVLVEPGRAVADSHDAHARGPRCRPCAPAADRAS